MAKVVASAAGEPTNPFASVSGFVGEFATCKLVDNGACWNICMAIWLYTEVV